MSKLYFVGNNKPVTESDFIDLLKQYDPRQASPELRQAIESSYGREYAQQECDTNSLQDLKECF